MRPRGLLANWIGHDLRLAFRSLSANKQSTVLSVLTLALGLGATSAAFKTAHAWLIRPLPLPEPSRLVRVEVRHVRGAGARYRDFLDLRAQNQVFEELAIVTWSKASLAERDGAVPITSYRTTAGTASVLGVSPTLGRFYNEAEDSPGGWRVALVSESAWNRRFGRRADVVGSAVTINEQPHTIVGVMPDRAAPPGMPTSEFWLPLRENPAGARIGQQYGPIFGRLKPGVALEAARTQMDTVARAIEEANPDSNRGWQVRLIGAQAFIRDQAFVSVVALFSIALCLLLLVCANVAGILLARASGRVHEMAVRAALGASRWHIVRQFLTESIVLGILAGVGGVLVSNWLLRAGTALVPDRGVENTLRLDGWVLLFTFGLSIATGLLFGLSSAFQGSRAQLGTALQASATRTGGPWRRGRLLSSLVVLEIALSLVLLVGGGLLTRDVLRLLATDTGVRSDVVTFQVELPGRYASAAQRGSYLARMVERLERIAGVEAVAAVEALPMSGFKTAGSFTLGTDALESRDGLPRAILNAATPGYFEVMGIPLLSGRDFIDSDARGTPDVAVTNRALADRYAKGSSILGQQVTLSDGRVRTIVGVVGNVRHDGPRQPPAPEIYLPLAEAPSREMFLVVRSSTGPQPLIAAVRDVARTVDPLVIIARLRTMDAVIEDALMQPRQMSYVLTGFALFGLLLAGTGLYGVISYAVGRRTHEIGIRMAMGATAGSILRLVVRKGLLLAAIGLVVGLPMAFAFARLLTSFLTFTGAQDVAVFTAVPIVVLAVAMAATYIPAHRATRVSPAVALRCE